jgi:hypothetical protein
MKIMPQEVLLVTPVTSRQYLVPMICTSINEKAQVKKVPNPRPPHPIPQHLGAVLQWPTQERNSHIVLQAKEDIRTLPPTKLKVLTNFP